MPDRLEQLAALHARMLANAGGHFEADCDDDSRQEAKVMVPDLIALARAVEAAALGCADYCETSMVSAAHPDYVCTCGRKAVREALARVRGTQA